MLPVEGPSVAVDLGELDDSKEQEWLDAVESMESGTPPEPGEADWFSEEKGEEPDSEDWPEAEGSPDLGDWAEAGEEIDPEDWADREESSDTGIGSGHREPFHGLFWGILSALLLLFFGTGAFLFYRGMYQVEPAFSQATYELGDPISVELGDYLQGSDWSVGLGELDLSGVDRNQAGTYQAVVRHGGKEYLYQITIEDTVAPEIFLRDGPVYLAVNRRYTAEEVIAGVQDMDPKVKLSFAEDGGNRDAISFQETGSFSCMVVAEDSSGNRSQAALWVTVDTPPEISEIGRAHV